MKKLLVISLLLVALQCASQNFNVSKTKFNTDYSEYCAGLIKDGVIYSSNKKPEVLKTYLDENDNYYTNLYVASENLEGKKKKTELFSSEISSVLNEGSLSFEPGGRAFWYTSNITYEEKKVRGNKNYKLGIYKAKKVEGKWQRVQSFRYNSKDQSYNVAHPAISPDGSFMIFSSDMEGGVGASDLYISYRTDEEWSTPELLPEGINTMGNELFPYIDATGILYFSSNGMEQGQGLDIYSTAYFNSEDFKVPVRMKAPINTEFDDYAFMIREDGETGYFSSNRDSLNDDVYEFKYMFPDFDGCRENFKPFMCYMIEETNITYIDTLPLAYIWEFGDGTTANGFRNEHCYADTGLYKINLNIIDTLTGVTYASISNMELLIEQPNQPYITSPDTLIMNEEALFSSRESTFDGFEVSEWFWDMGSEKSLRGEEVVYAFNKPGYYQIELGALGFPDESGLQQRSCVYKTVLVVENELELEILRELTKEQRLEQLAAAKEKEVTLAYEYLQEEVVDGNNPEEAMLEEKAESTYYVEVAESEERIELEDPFFDKLQYEITERLKDDSTYVYSVGKANEVFALWDMYKEVLDSGYYSAIVKQKRLSTFEEETEQVGFAIPEDERKEWNRTITKFANIQFDKNSSYVSKDCYSSLDYIAVIMDIEKEFVLSIDAYTDDSGNADHNLELSIRRADNVKKYLIRKGVPQERLVSKGHGEAEPISSNKTEQGRAINRRVEFELETVLFKLQIE
ncbi:MAG: OmpA family protein [Flavobacteriales bacterium]